MDLDYDLHIAAEHLRGKRLAQAEAVLRGVLALDAAHPQALHLLGLVHHAGGRMPAAIEYLVKAATADPGSARIRLDQGRALQQGGRSAEAIDAFIAAARLDPDDLTAATALGVALFNAGRHAESVEALHAAVRIKPDSISTVDALCRALHAKGDADAAANCYRMLLSLDPENASAHLSLSGILNRRGDHRAAAAHAAECGRLAPALAPARVARGDAHAGEGQLDEAIAAYREALHLDAKVPGAQLGLARTLLEQGQAEDATVAGQRAVESAPADATAWAILLRAMCCAGGATAAELRAAHAAREQRVVVPRRAARQPHATDRAPDRLLRLGFLSPDFHGEGAVGPAIGAVLARLDRQQFEIFCYAAATGEDAVTRRMRWRATEWRGIAGAGDEEVASLIRADGIDLLIDLSAHGPDDRLALLAHRPAPVQVAQSLFPMHTGSEAIDYRITDAHLDPHASENINVPEQLGRVSTGFFPAPAPATGSPASAPPAVANGFVTFGCLASPALVTRQCVALWCRLLHRVPRARIMLLTRGPGDARAFRLAQFAERGIAADRVECILPMVRADRPTLHGRIDIALAPAPCSDAAATIDALYAGVPIVTLAGPTAPARAAASVLAHAGLAQWIARDAEDYVNLAAQLAADPNALARLRTELPARAAASPMASPDAYANALGETYRQMWRAYCARA